MIERRIAQGRASEVGRFIVAAQGDRHTTALTNRLLAFGRRQTLQPTIIAPDLLLRGMMDLIQSGVGPTIRL